MSAEKRTYRTPEPSHRPSTGALRRGTGNARLASQAWSARFMQAEPSTPRDSGRPITLLCKGIPDERAGRSASTHPDAGSSPTGWQVSRALHSRAGAGAPGSAASGAT